MENILDKGTKDQEFSIIDNLHEIQDKAREYMGKFVSDDSSIQNNFDLKRAHIEQVAQYAEQIVGSLSFEKLEETLAITAAWLHDIGRFVQLTEQRTYIDTPELDHGVQGVKIINEMELLSQLDENSAEVLLFAVENHNKMTVPKTNNKLAMDVVKIVRDADKLDIIEQTIDEFCYRNKKRKRNPLFSLNLKDSPAISPAVAKCLKGNEIIPKNELNTTSDFKLMIMQSVVDLNFKKSYIILSQKQMMQQLLEFLPKSDIVFDAFQYLKIQIENNIR